MNKEFNYVLFKYDYRDSAYYFISIDELPRGGFTSLYNITHSTAQTLQANGFKGYKGPVWSEWLWIDEDTEQGAVQTERRLRELGLGFQIYSTGNRGKHFRIRRRAEPSQYLPYTDREWVSKISTTADPSIYTHLHPFRLEGTRHESTGRPKAIEQYVEGADLELNIIEPPVRTSAGEFSATESLFLNQTIMSLTTSVDLGKRNERLVGLAVGLKKLGEDSAFIYRWLHHTNLLFANPVEDSEIAKIVEWVEGIQ